MVPRGAAEISVIPFHDKRTARRRVISLSAHARELDAEVFPVEIADLSTDGCKISGRFSLEQGTHIWIRLPGIGARRARIAWTDASGVGCEFLSPLSQKIIDEAGEIVRIAQLKAARRRRNERMAAAR